MKFRRIFLVIFIILSSVIGLATMQDYIPNESQSVDVDEFFSEVKTINVEISDGVGSVDNG